MTRSGPATAGAEVVTIGDELLFGQTVDENGAWLARRLAGAGIRVGRITTVDDDEAAIRAVVAEALARQPVVICTGGLGPTPDDRTRAALSAVFQRPLRLDAAVLTEIEERSRASGISMTELGRAQAEVPTGATVFPNRLGTAPGLALQDDNGRVAVLLPGVPTEMRAIFEEHVLPFLLASYSAPLQPIRHRVVRTAGVAESVLAQDIESLSDGIRPCTLAFLPSITGVDLRLTCRVESTEEAADRLLDQAESLLRDRIEPFVYGVDDDRLADSVGRSLAAAGFRLVIAESCTGGLLGSWLTDRAGASDFFVGGFIAYHDSVKSRVLQVDRRLLAEHGAVSEPTVRAMIHGARTLTGAPAAIAVTGVAGPGGGSAEKPVGTVWVAAALDEDLRSERHRFSGDRPEVRARAAQAGLVLLRSILKSPSARPVID